MGKKLIDSHQYFCLLPLSLPGNTAPKGGKLPQVETVILRQKRVFNINKNSTVMGTFYQLLFPVPKGGEKAHYYGQDHPFGGNDEADKKSP